jgi:ribosomal protein S10
MPDFMANTKAWEESKREGDVLLKVVATNKSTDKDLKVWFNLGSKSAVDKDNQNFEMRTSHRKFYLARKNQRIVEHILKIDPTKPFFFKNIDDIKVDLDVVVRNAETTQNSPVLPYTGGKRVHYADITAGIGVSTQANEFDDEREDPDFDDSAYEHYQRSPHYAGYDGPEGRREADAMGLLLHQSGEDADGSRED